MSDVGLISYRARTRNATAGYYDIVQTATSLRDPQVADRWRQRLDPWLRAGSPKGCAYLDFGAEAAFIQWQATSVSHLEWLSATVRVGDSAALTGTLALELPEPDGPGFGTVSIRPGSPGPRRAEIEAWARSADVIAQLIPLLAHALVGERRVTMPWTAAGRPEAVMWGLVSILRMIGDTRPVSCLTYAAGPVRDGGIPGLLVIFRADATAPLPPDQGFVAVAADLAHQFAAGPAALRRALADHGVPDAADPNSRISRLLGMRLRTQPGNVNSGGTATADAGGRDASGSIADAGSSAGEPAVAGEPAAGSGPTVVTGASLAAGPAGPGSGVLCPVCLHEILDWDSLTYWYYTSDGDYEEIRIPADASRAQRERRVHGAYVRCPSTKDDATAVHHYLPANYAQFGEPVLLGFVGLTQSGKSHLLASMIGGIGHLSDYRIDVHPLDPATHHRFLENSVKPLITRNEVLPGTPDDATTEIADAFIVRHGNGPERVVALFDVSGGVLAQTDMTREFLWIADGLFFVIDPEHIRASRAGDDTFSNVLNVMRGRAKPEPVSAAIVLNKADKARFEEPVARWLRSGNGTMDPTEFLRESADVYSYLEEHGAAVLTEPYQVCEKTTLHVASPTGGAQEGEEKGSKYPRGVTPLRVLRPLVAMLAMTGVLTGPQAEMIGV
jgi:hypothetical protein